MSCFECHVFSEAREGQGDPLRALGMPGKSQKGGQEEQGEVEEPRRKPLATLGSPGPLGLPFGSSRGYWGVLQTSLREKPCVFGESPAWILYPSFVLGSP